jgi:hypothetical protein
VPDSSRPAPLQTSSHVPMKPQARPFTVEVKIKRKPLQASRMNWSTVIDEPAPDDVPSRDIREDAAETPWAAASRVFSAFATSALSSAPSLGGLAASVFTPRPQEQPAEALAIEEGRAGQILPSLLPLNRFDAAAAGESGPVRKRATARRPRKLIVGERQEAPEPTDVGSDPAIPPTIAPPERSATATPAAPRGRKNGRRASTRVRPGEGWKRRRLPKACW